MLRFRFACLLALVLTVASLSAQSVDVHPVFSRLNGFGAFGEYSNDSSHILLGNAEQRKMLNLGLSYSRRILLRPFVDLQYIAEVRPILFESDPVVHVTETFNFPTAPKFDSSFSSLRGKLARAMLACS